MLRGTNDLKIFDFGNAIQTNRTKRKDLNGVIQIFLHLMDYSPRIGHGKAKAIIKKRNRSR
ncbi:hypothetical protein D7Z54_02195 [Salibacterium salarium]|uniref:Uncharacterized protein n=1 Tax=Salibacterium salarium TaxID=284579 RepID=A0A428NAI9_9BACI|nr:hypothetical protein D7Z54_02195 [Salibacterium salarium]